MRAENRQFKVICAGDLAEVYLYDVIGEDMFGGISAKMFADELGKAKGAKRIDVRINSPGGDVFAGNTIYTLLKSHSAKVNVFIDGLAASIASVIAMAGDTIEISQNGMLMIHDPFGGSFGTAEEHRKLADLLDKVKDSIAETYVSRSGMDKSHALALMADETWFSAQEAVDAKLVDRIGSDLAIAACVRSDLFKFKHMPESLVAKAGETEEPAAVLSFESELRRKINSYKVRD
jgi:ATP-dependent protease ClpP protease subunit